MGNTSSTPPTADRPRRSRHPRNSYPVRAPSARDVDTQDMAGHQYPSSKHYNPNEPLEPVRNKDGAVGANNLCRTCLKLLRSINNSKAQNQDSFKHYSSTQQLDDSAVACQLCELFRLSLRGATTKSLGYMNTAILMRLRETGEQALVDSTEIRVEILDSFIPFSPHLPFRFLKPNSGLGGYTRVGKSVAICSEKLISKCKQHSRTNST